MYKIGKYWYIKVREAPHSGLGKSRKKFAIAFFPREFIGKKLRVIEVNEHKKE